MKLYLSSYRVPTPDELFGLLLKPPAGCRIAIVPNAQDYRLPEERGVRLDEVATYLESLGLQSDIVDLREYDDGDSLYHVLKPYDAVWVAGGNSFVVRSEMRRSGFDTIILKLLHDGMVYCGESAGAIVAGLTLQGCEPADEPELADQIIWEGLGLTERIIAPHADRPEFVEYINHMKKLYKDNDRVLYLNDNQAFAIDDNR